MVGLTGYAPGPRLPRGPHAYRCAPGRDRLQAIPRPVSLQLPSPAEVRLGLVPGSVFKTDGAPRERRHGGFDSHALPLVPHRRTRPPTASASAVASLLPRGCGRIQAHHRGARRARCEVGVPHRHLDRPMSHGGPGLPRWTRRASPGDWRRCGVGRASPAHEGQRADRSPQAGTALIIAPGLV